MAYLPWHTGVFQIQRGNNKNQICGIDIHQEEHIQYFGNICRSMENLERQVCAPGRPQASRKDFPYTPVSDWTEGTAMAYTTLLCTPALITVWSMGSFSASSMEHAMSTLVFVSPTCFKGEIFMNVQDQATLFTYPKLDSIHEVMRHPFVSLWHRIEPGIYWLRLRSIGINYHKSDYRLSKDIRSLAEEVWYEVCQIRTEVSVNREEQAVLRRDVNEVSETVSESRVELQGRQWTKIKWIVYGIPEAIE